MRKRLLPAKPATGWWAIEGFYPQPAGAARGRMIDWPQVYVTLEAGRSSNAACIPCYITQRNSRPTYIP